MAEMNMNKELTAMLIKFYNMQAGTMFRANNDWNQRMVATALDKLNGDVVALKTHIKTWVAENPENKNIAECFEAVQGQPKVIDVETVEVKPEAPATEQAVGSALGLLDKVLVELVARTSSEKIEAEIMGQVQDSVRNFIKSEYGTIERKIVTVVDDKKAPVQGIQHDKFETVLKFVANNEPVFLTGPAGSGKNVLCKQVAEALGLKFYFTNAVTQEYKLTGFTDAMGNFQETQFYKAFTQGGLFMLDEMDASIPEVLVILNAAIANRYFDFPAPIGYVEAHPDFRVIAAGNTTGHGADYQYVGRNQLDAASLDRFAVVKIDYCEAIENSVACGDMELANFCREFRKAADIAGVQVVVSYRAIGRLAKMVQLLGIEEALETCLVKGIERDDVNNILNGITTDSKYKTGLRKVMRSM